MSKYTTWQKNNVFQIMTSNTPANQDARTPLLPITSKSFLNWCIAFKDCTGPMANYLRRKQLLKAFYTFCELLTIFKELIRDDENFDQYNPSIILADPELEKALGQQAVSVKEIRNVIIKHVKLAEPGSAFRPTLCFLNNEKKSVVGTPVIYLDFSGKTFDAYLFARDLIPHATYSGPVTTDVLRATMTNGFSIQYGKKENRTLCSIKCLTLTLTDQELTNFFALSENIQAQAKSGKLTDGKSLDEAIQPPLTNYNCPLEIQNQPAIPTPKLLSLLQTISGEPKRKIFTYKEVFQLINSYILHKQEELFAANSLIIVVEEDPLGEIFKLKAFHQGQLGELIHLHLSPAQDTPKEKNTIQQSEMIPKSTSLPMVSFRNQNLAYIPQTKRKCFSCKRPTGNSKVFCVSCWQIRKKKIGPSFQPPKTHQPKIKNKLGRNKQPTKLIKSDDLCKICFQKEAKAGFLHGQTFHLFGCLNCCREIYLTNYSCPLCRRLIEKIILKYDA